MFIKFNSFTVHGIWLSLRAKMRHVEPYRDGMGRSLEKEDFRDYVAKYYPDKDLSGILAGINKYIEQLRANFK